MAKNNSPSLDGRLFRSFSPSAFQTPCYSFQATRWKVVFKEKKRVSEKLLESQPQIANHSEPSRDWCYLFPSQFH